MIPNVFHFIFGLSEDFGGKPFNLSHYLAIKSSIQINKPDKVYFYYKHLPQTEYFKKIQDKLELVKIDPPTEIFGNLLYHVAHKADIIRLEALKNKGGIYMDIDTICIKPFTPLLNNKFVIGEQISPDNKNIQGLCNAVILSEPNSTFINTWFNSYKHFRAKPLSDDINASGGMNYSYWDEHSVYVPKFLSKQLPKKLHIENYKSFHYPIWDDKGIKMLFEEDHNMEGAYCHHLWESTSWKHLNNLTEEEIKTKDTTYNKIARRFL
jgi:mannosyltransferase OCH1-like enzyme